MTNGWFGSKEAISHALGIVGADREEDGAYRITGRIFVGLDGDIVLGDDACFFVEGERRQLAALMRTTSQGLGVAVY
jgi:hypothetical protein